MNNAVKIQNEISMYNECPFKPKKKLAFTTNKKNNTYSSNKKNYHSLFAYSSTFLFLFVICL